MAVYYNECDPFCAQWLRNLISKGHIAPGYVDERSICDVYPDDLHGFDQCHFFAGIGVWSKALRNAGWPDDRPVWTGSCPCQPFSASGNKEGFSDERHLWPSWFHLLKERKPSVILGEQVASALEWVDLVCSDMESQNYTFAPIDLCSAGFDGAHSRQRLYFVGLANSTGWNTRPQRQQFSREYRLIPKDIVALRRENIREISERDKQLGVIPLSLGRECVDWIGGKDGKFRPVESGTFPLVDATPKRLEQIRAYGNGLDLEVATQFCESVKEILEND